MISCIHRHARAGMGATLLAAILAALGCSSGSGGSAPYEIISPATRNVVVAPGQTVRFEIRTNGGRSVEYIIDDVRSEPGPTFTLQPVAQHHVVKALILSGDLAAAPDIILFTVEVEAPGNLPPQITSFVVEPVTGEAEDTEFTAQVAATDADGTIATVSVDFGDSTPPAQGGSVPFTATHTYTAEGTYSVTARVVDDLGVPASAVRQVVVDPHNEPPTGSLHAEEPGGSDPIGTGPLTIRLETEGHDTDGAIATWEIDKDLGAGYELISAGEDVTISYPFQEDPYAPTLRLIDDKGEMSVIAADNPIVVLRDVDASESDLAVTGNSLFEKTPVAPVVWADGTDRMNFILTIRDSGGLPVPGVRVRVASARPARSAPDGNILPPSEIILPAPELTADNDGRVTGWVVTNLSTRVEPVPDINLQSFGLEFQVDLGRDFWVPFEIGPVALNAQSTVSDAAGRVRTMPEFGCPGQPLEVIVEAANDNDSPTGASPAREKYTELRNADGELLPAHRPAPGFANWRTDQSGEIHLIYIPVRADQNQLFIAWVDGRPLRDLGSVALKPPSQCNGQ